MDYIANSARKIGRFFSSPPQASSLGKRKADCRDDNDPVEDSDTDSDSVTSDDPINALDGYFGHELPQPPQKRICKSTTVRTDSRTDSVTKSANEAVQRARTAMGKSVTTLAEQVDEQDIQDELERQSCQEKKDRHDIVEHQKKKQATPRKPKQGLVAELVTSEQNASTSKAKPSSKPSKPKASAPHTDSTRSKAQWLSKPNTRARQVLEEHGINSTELLKDVQEPEYACRDAEIRDGVWKMMDQIEVFAKEHFSFKIKYKTRLRATFKSMQKETVKIIGCVASGGPAGASGWEDLFLDNNKRQALVCAIIGNVLVEQVFQHLFFGGTEEQIKEVAALQVEHRNDDGFDRNTLYATKVRSFLASPSYKGKAPANTTPTLHLPANFNTHINHIVAALYTHLKPLHSLTSRTSDPIPSLHALTTHAALLSLHMRLNAHTAYHFTPVFKDQPYTRSEMECINHTQMISTHPRGAGSADLISEEEQARRATLPKTETARMQSDQGLIQITLLPGITAYRRGGWEKPCSTLENVEFEEGCEGKGVRARRLTDAWVYCRWGRQRVWKDGKPADEPETHGVGWNGGFVEFYPGVEGVTDPDPERTARKRKAEEELEKVVEVEDKDEDV